MNSESSDRDTTGWVNALAAFGWWGFVFPLVLLWGKSEGRDQIESAVTWSFELLSLRILSCVVFCLVLLWVTGKLTLLIQVFKTPRLLLWFALSSFLIFLNWLGFIIGASTNNLSQASLGYYMGPLFNVLLGYLFLGERLRKPQFFAVGVAAAGILWLTILAGEFPWIALTLAMSFGCYGLVRKKVRIDAVVGLTMETIYCVPLSIGIVVYLANQDHGLVFAEGTHLLRWIVIFTGPATAIPLICFAIAANRLRLGTLGFIQFVAPTGQFILATIFDNQPFTSEKLIGFSFVWAAVAIYLLDLWITNRSKRKLAGE